jgi:hypothetical protein
MQGDKNNKTFISVFNLSMNCYFCRMIRKFFLILIVLGFSPNFSQAQSDVKTSELFRRPDNNSTTGQLNIIQDPAIDTLISRYVLGNINLYNEHAHYGMEGFRIQIYASSNRNAREESNKARAQFISKFPDIVSYPLYAEPGYFKIRVGDFRTKAEATKTYLIVSKEFPDAYLVPDFINFPDLNIK